MKNQKLKALLGNKLSEIKDKSIQLFLRNVLFLDGRIDSINEKMFLDSYKINFPEEKKVVNELTLLLDS